MSSKKLILNFLSTYLLLLHGGAPLECNLSALRTFSQSLPFYHPSLYKKLLLQQASQMTTQTSDNTFKKSLAVAYRPYKRQLRHAWVSSISITMETKAPRQENGDGQGFETIGGKRPTNLTKAPEQTPQRRHWDAKIF